MSGEWYTDTPEYRALAKYLAVDAPNPNGWWDAFCPIHQDSKRSAGINFESGLWSCRAGCGSGTISDLLKMLDEGNVDDDYSGNTGLTGGFDDAEVIDLAQRRAKKNGTKPPPSEEDLARWATALKENKDKFAEHFERRGITLDTLVKYGIGWAEELDAWIIPVRNAEGTLINVRLWNHNRPKTKIWSWGSADFDTNAIYPEAILKENNNVVICEGEWDALIAIDRGFPAVSGTTGALQWQPKWNRKFKDKDVVLVYDRDDSGVRGAAKAAQNLEGIARSVAIAELPLPWSQRHGQDTTDFFHVAGHSADDFAGVLRDAQVYAAPKDGSPAKVSVRESYNPDLVGKPMSMTVSVVGKGLQTHIVPKAITFSCDMSAGPACHGCPMVDNEGMANEEVDPASPVVLSLREVNTQRRDETLRDHFGIHKCKKLVVDVRESQTTEALVVRTSIEEAEDDDHRSRTIINVGEYRTDTNVTVKLTGTAYPSPVNQESVFQAWRLDPVESSLDTYEISQESIQLMKRFRPRRGQSPLKKCGEIARNITEHVTHIYDRLALHIGMDLVYHSALTFPFGGQVLERGWLELLIVGDARTGKSEVANKLTKHYRFGRIVSCESASIPGLLGAVKPMPGASKSWTLEWGAIPLNDRRLVILDEVGGLTTEQIGQLSSLRSSGLAEIVKAEREITHARTRLVWMGNPRNNIHGMASFMYGVHAVTPLIGSQEDVARFDFAMSLATDDVPSSAINRRRRPGAGTNPYSSEACHALLQWTWSRTKDDVLWDDDAEDEVYKYAEKMGKTYVPDPPLVQMQNVRVKIARMAVAFAARTFSTDPTYQKIKVTKAHVKSAVDFLNHIYGDSKFGYLEISKRAKKYHDSAHHHKDEVEEYLRTRQGLAPFLIRSGGTFRRQQLEEQLNYGKEEANVVITYLTQRGMLASTEDGFSYKCSPPLNDILRKVKDD